MPDLLPTFDELYAISDLHLGGERHSAIDDFQIFRQGPRLAGLIDLIAQRRPDDRVALVLNGDIIDALAEDGVPGYIALDEGTALRMIERIWNDASFVMVWQALVRFLAQPRRHLILVLGNHDIELALPVVEADLRHRLGGSDIEVQSRLVFSTHGGGFACRVGRARVFCSHGNEVDPMNWVNQDQLGQLANAMAAGRPGRASEWKPNGGTRVVIDVMNKIKRHYPFIDLLKPETAAIAGVLMAIDRDTFRQIDLGDAFPILRDRLRGGSVTDHLLGAEAGSTSAAPSPRQTADAVLQHLIGSNLRDGIQGSGGTLTSEDELLLQAGADADGGQPASARLAADGTPETLGLGDYFAGFLGMLPKSEALRRALQDCLKDDPSFHPTSTTGDNDQFEQMKPRIGPDIDFVITGHSHLARALQLPGGGGYYNCGTWIRLMRLKPEVLGNREIFENQVWPALKAGNMQALDNATLTLPDGTRMPLLFDSTHVVRLSAAADQTSGDLLRVTGGEPGTPVQLIAESDPQGQPIPPIKV